MKKELLKQKLLATQKESFTGWDFSYLKGRVKDEQITWNYELIIKKYLKKEHQLLDMGTGGGEFLLTLQHLYHKTCVSEGYEPNVKLCEERLSPLGITVKKCEEETQIPYDDAIFDIIINRHSAYDVKEIYRALKSGGIFITQQIGNQNDQDLVKKVLGHNTCVEGSKDLNEALNEIDPSQFEILCKDECFSPIEFYDIEAFVYFASIINWEFVDFSVDTHFSALYKLQQEINETGCISGEEHRYLLILKKK